MKTLQYDYLSDVNLNYKLVALLLMAVVAGLYGMKELVKYLLEKLYEVFIQHSI